MSSASFDLTVGALVPLTGALSPFGPAGEKAADLAIQEAQAALEGTDITLADLASADTETKATSGSNGGGAAHLGGGELPRRTMGLGRDGPGRALGRGS